MARQETLPARTAAPAAPAKATPAARDFRALIEASAPRLADVIPAVMRKHLTPERIIRVSRAAYNRKKELRECDPLSILNAIVQAAQLGFEADGPLGHAYIVPYGGVAELQIGYKGFADLARRTASYDLIDSRLIHAKDAFRLEYDPSPVFRHVPDLGGDPGKVVHAYAYAYLRGSARPVFEIVTLKDLEAIRNRSKSRNSPAWRDYPGEMYKKVAMKRMLKDQPLSVELADALAYDNRVNAIEDAAPARAATGLGMRGLNDRLALASAPNPGDEPEFTAEQGVARPLRSEADDDGDEGIVPDEFVPGPGREAGEEG